MRAGKGLLVSTHAQDQAKGMHLDAIVAKQQLEANLTQAKALSDVAKNQKTDPLEALEKLKAFMDQLSQEDPTRAATFKTAVMLLAAPQSIALSTNEDMHLSADGQINQTAGDSINISTQKNLIAQVLDKISLFAVQQGISLISAQEKVELIAQSAVMDLIARHDIKIISTEENIEITAKKKILISGR